MTESEQLSWDLLDAGASLSTPAVRQSAAEHAAAAPSLHAEAQ